MRSKTTTILLVMGVMSAASAHATVMVEVPLEQMARSADAIAVGTVLRSEARLVLEPGHGHEPHTFTELAVREWIAGGSAARVTVEELGGEVAGERYHIAGTPRFEPGQEVVVFLEQRDDGSLRTLAMAQGKFEIRRGAGGTPDSVRRELDELTFVRWANGQMNVAHVAGDAVELEVFLETVRRLARTLRYTPPTGTPPTNSGGAIR